jgi:pyruvate/2-oxoglutarate dehydrogenase complex dihydrolipoamide dehydrogenase (E3) component
MGEIADWLASELAQLGVDIHLGVAADATDVLNSEPDAVIVATGSRPRRDGYQIATPLSPIPGAGLPHVKTSWDVYVDGAGTARSAVVFDDVGHYEAIAVAEQLLNAGMHVTFVTRLPRIAPLLEPARMEGTVKRRLMPRDFDFVVDAGLLAIEPDKVVVGSLYGGRPRSVPADLVVMVGANLPARELADQLGGRVPQVELVGDALGPRFLQLAMADGFKAGAAV